MTPPPSYRCQARWRSYVGCKSYKEMGEVRRKWRKCGGV